MNKKLFLIILLATGFSCTTHPDLESEKKALLAIHEGQRKAHFEKNAAGLLRQSSEDYTEVNKGLVKRPAYNESLSRFTSYFDAVDFVKWDDVSPPIISFSDDASMATMVVEKLVIIRNKSENNRLDTTHYAWLAVYKKVNRKWELHRMGSTNQ